MELLVYLIKWALKGKSHRPILDSRVAGLVVIRFFISNKRRDEANNGLIWQKAEDGIWQTWQATDDYCEKLNLGNSSDWRLPNRRELYSVIDFWPTSCTVN